MDIFKKHIYDESNGLHYTLEGDYYIPDLKLQEENRSIPPNPCGFPGNRSSSLYKKCICQQRWSGSA